MEKVVLRGITKSHFQSNSSQGVGKRQPTDPRDRCGARIKMEHNTDRCGDLEVEDDGPYQAQGQLGVSVRNVVVSDVHQLHLRATETTAKQVRKRSGEVE